LKLEIGKHKLGRDETNLRVGWLQNWVLAFAGIQTSYPELLRSYLTSLV